MSSNLDTNIVHWLNAQARRAAMEALSTRVQLALTASDVAQYGEGTNPCAGTNREEGLSVNFYHLEDPAGGHHLVTISDVTMALSGSAGFAALARRYRSVDLVCTVSVTPMDIRTYSVEMHDEAKAKLGRIHAEYPQLSAEPWLPLQEA